MKRSYILAVCASAVLAMAGCSGNTGPEAEQSESTAGVIEISTNEGLTEAEVSTAVQGDGEDIGQTGEEASKTETGTGDEEALEREAKTEYENETSVIELDAETKGYADNFEVDSQAAAEFAKLIKAAVSAKDMEELAGLMGFPVYVGAAGGGVESKEEFLSLGEELIFTDELTDSVLSADTGDLKPSEAGFVLSDGGSANIIFGVRDGKLMISGINY